MLLGTKRLPVRAGRKPSKRAYEPYVLLAPAVLLIVVFAGYPLLRSVWMAFNKVSAFSGEMAFIGFENFAAILRDPEFPSHLGRTAMWVGGAVFLQLIGGLILALLVNTRFPLRGVYRGLIMVPWATPSVLVALMWKWLLDPNNGIINKGISALGLSERPVEFLSNPDLALPTLVVIDVWQGVPLFAVMILAALQGVSGDLKEAAATDGCGPIGVFRFVVLPAIIPTILITVLLRIIWTANYIDLIFILTGGGPGLSSTTLALQSYLTAYKSTNFGQGAAYSVLQAAILVIFVVMYLRLTAKSEAQR
ncbi:sugar ABC transporter permease [Tessaracoccus sp. OS52]|uniref:carbohydrate ABC transporter permease n=1 Tax=Tessaracoccus sp. OS52 TaxID=2886691 RepID=UPI001D12F48F|nr:sugar ABC transporter permease [Tessaracoccus sp. OS52]MCC2594313.1 sugar ABC transporter permease [Tessaracoccus sp. OS52]